MAKCYACDEIATTTEHVPPKSFFPKNERINLFTVPSCKLHNNDNSKDVEYVRNVITMHFLNNVTGFDHFQNKTFKSFKHSISLFKTTLKNSKKVTLNGGDVITFPIDLERFENVMNHIGKALYFKEFNIRFKSSFYVYSYSLYFQETIQYNKKIPEIDNLNSLLDQISFKERNTSNPSVFRYYYFGENNQNFIFKLEFYNGFFVFLLPQDKFK